MAVKDIIKDLPISPAELARQLNVSDGHVHDWRSGRRTPTVERATIIEQVTGVYGVVAAVVAERSAKARAKAEARNAA